jgi:hypothetical protein
MKLQEYLIFWSDRAWQPVITILFFSSILTEILCWVDPTFPRIGNSRLDFFGGEQEIHRAFIILNVVVAIQVIKDIFASDELLNPLIDNMVLLARPTHSLIDRIGLGQNEDIICMIWLHWLIII